MKNMIAAALCTLLMLGLSACGTPAAEVTPSPSSSPAASLRPTQTPAAVPTPTATPSPSAPTGLEPITEEILLRDPAFQGDYSILDVIPAEDGFFVWYGPQGATLDGDGRYTQDRSQLTWVDKHTGEKVPLPMDDDGTLALVEIPQARHATVRTTGVSHINGWRGVPVTYHFVIDEQNKCQTQRDPWQTLETELDLGIARAAVVADARVGVNDLAVVFVPPASEAGISGFIAAATYIPSVSIRYEADRGAIFLTLHDTALQSGELEEGCEDWVYDFIRDNGLDYPYRTPTGTLGEDNRFFTNAAISTNGTDTTITLLLTAHAQRYAVEVEYLAQDMYPTLRLVFQDQPH